MNLLRVGCWREATVVFKVRVTQPGSRAYPSSLRTKSLGCGEARGVSGRRGWRQLDSSGGFLEEAALSLTAHFPLSTVLWGPLDPWESLLLL